MKPARPTGVHASLHEDGTYTMTNSRNGYSKTYRTK